MKPRFAVELYFCVRASVSKQGAGWPHDGIDAEKK